MHELDLHGHTLDEALSLFRNFYNRLVRRRAEESLRVIHGYGSSGDGGKIRRQLRAFLEEAGDRLEWRPGEDVEGNPGVTIVFPRKLLPDPADRLASGIVAFCSIPRTESKIAGEFRRHPARDVKQALRSLVRQGQLKVILKAGHETYVNVASASK
jgi:hypothetical protein